MGKGERSNREGLPVAQPSIPKVLIGTPLEQADLAALPGALRRLLDLLDVEEGKALNQGLDGLPSALGYTWAGGRGLWNIDKHELAAYDAIEGQVTVLHAGGVLLQEGVDVLSYGQLVTTAASGESLLAAVSKLSPAPSSEKLVYEKPSTLSATTLNGTNVQTSDAPKSGAYAWTPTDVEHFGERGIANSYTRERTKVQYDTVPSDAPFKQVTWWTFPPLDHADAYRSAKEATGINLADLFGSKPSRQLTLPDITKVLAYHHQTLLDRFRLAKNDPALLEGGVIMTGEVATTALLPFITSNYQLGTSNFWEVFDQSVDRVHKAACELARAKGVTVYLGTIRPAEVTPAWAEARDSNGKLLGYKQRLVHNTFLVATPDKMGWQDKRALYWGSVKPESKTFSDFESFAVGVKEDARITPYADGVAVFLNCHEFKAIHLRPEKLRANFAVMRSVYAQRGPSEQWRIGQLDEAERAMLELHERFSDPTFVSSIKAVYHNSNYTSPMHFWLDWTRASAAMGKVLAKSSQTHPGIWLYNTNLGSGGKTLRMSGLYRMQPPHPVVGYAPLVDQAPGENVRINKV